MKNGLQASGFRLRAVALITMVALVLATSACDQSEYHKAADAAAKIATGLGAIEQLNESLYSSSHLIEKDEAIAIATLTIEATRANDEFIGRMKSLKQIDGSNSALIAGWFGEVATSVATLNEQGVLHIKNRDAQAKLAIALSTVQAAVQIIQATLGSAPAVQKGNHEPGSSLTSSAARARRDQRGHEAGLRTQNASRHERRTVARIRFGKERGNATSSAGVYRATEAVGARG